MSIVDDIWRTLTQLPGPVAGAALVAFIVVTAFLYEKCDWGAYISMVVGAAAAILVALFVAPAVFAMLHWI
jgi:hypothetical protein